MARHDPRGTQGAVANIMKWAQRPEWASRYADVLEEHVGEVMETHGLASIDDLAEEIGATAFAACVRGPAFEDFLTRDDGEGETIVDDYVRRRGFKESVPGRRYLQALRDSVMSVYEVIESMPGSHLVLRDRLRGGPPVRVEERAGSRQLVKWDIFAGRVVPLNRQQVLSGTMLPVAPEVVERLELAFRKLAQALRKDLEREIVQADGGAAADEPADANLARYVLRKAETDRTWAETVERTQLPRDEAELSRVIEEKLAELATQLTLHMAAPLFTRLWLAQVLAEREAPPIEARNYDLEPIVPTETRWPLAAGAADVVRRLDAAESRRILRRDEDEPAWLWQGDKSLSHGPQVPPPTARGEPPPDLITLGDIEIEDGSLVLRTNSEGRAERGRVLLESVLDGLLGPAEVTRETPEEPDAQAAAPLSTRMVGRHRNQAPADIPPEVKVGILNDFKDRHYRAWLDMTIPALDGRTPRQAVETEEGRAKVIQHLKTLENREQRMARDEGLPPYDAAWIWRELGVSAEAG